MDYNMKDKSDGELDIQALLDKYLPEEEKEPRDGSELFFDGAFSDAAKDSVEQSENVESAEFDEANEIKEKEIKEIKEDSGKVFFAPVAKDVTGADAREEAFEGGFESDSAGDSTGDFANDLANESKENPGVSSGGPADKDDGIVYFDNAASDEGGPETDGVLENDGNFVIDEEIIKELMASDDVQFGGVEEFEDIENLSGFDAAADAENVSAEENAASSDEAAGVESAQTGTVAPRPDDFGEITNEDEYAEFVNASLGDLENGETTEADINLIVALGLEDELKKKVGAKSVSKITRRYDERAEAYEEKHKKTLHNEYRSPSQTKQISSEYKKAYLGLKVKLCFSVLFAILLFVYENLPIFGYQLSSFLDPAVYPVVYVMVDLQILLLCMAPAYDQIFSGFAKLFRAKPDPESILSLTALLSIGYSVLAAKTASVPTEPVLFNLPAAFCAVMTILYSYLTLKREIFSFNIVASKKDKFAMRRLSQKEASLEIAALGEDERRNGDILKIEKVSFVDEYFYRTDSGSSSGSMIFAMYIILTLVLAGLFGAYAGIMRYSIPESVSFAYIAFVTALPVSALLAYSYPFYKANSKAYEENSTIIGETSLEEYSDASVVSIDDKLVFPTVGVKVQNIKIYNNYRFDRVLYYAASVFTKTGGPLADIFELATAEMGYSDDVVLIGAGEGYIQTEVNGKSIMFGRCEELESLGVEIPDSIKDDDSPDTEASVMYMIFKGRAVAKMNILYTMDEDFEYIVKQLAGCGMTAFVKTLDPNIDGDMIKSRVNLENYPVKVIRYSSLDEASGEADRADSGIVARGSSKSLLRTVTYCDKVLEVKRTNSFISLIAAIITVVILAVLLMTDNFGTTVPFRSIYSVLCHLFWLIPVLITTKAIVR